MDLGFVGLGTMGHPMVERLLAAGHRVHVYNRSQPSVESLMHLGAVASDSAAMVGERAQLIHTALPTPESVDAVYREFTAIARSGQTYIEHSTVRPNQSRRWGAALAERGAGYLDAPVSGGPAGAVAGTLTIMVGGDPATFEAALPVLRSLGSIIQLFGPIGAGQAVKLVNQLLVGVHSAAAAEAMAFGVRMGADPAAMLDLVSKSYGASAMVSRNVPRYVSRDFSAATPIRMIIKDLGLIHDEARDLGVPLPIGGLVEQRFLEARFRGLAAEDMAAIIKLWESDAD